MVACASMEWEKLTNKKTVTCTAHLLGSVARSAKCGKHDLFSGFYLPFQCEHEKGAASRKILGARNNNSQGARSSSCCFLIRPIATKLQIQTQCISGTMSVCGLLPVGKLAGTDCVDGKKSTISKEDEEIVFLTGGSEWPSRSVVGHNQRSQDRNPALICMF